MIHYNQLCLFILDISSIVIILVVAYLSKRLNYALKLRPYYMLCNLSIGIIALSIILDTISVNKFNQSPASFITILSTGLRCFAGCMAAVSCTPYWRWLFKSL